MNTYKWPDASLSLSSALSALGDPLGVKKSATTVAGIGRKQLHESERFREVRPTAAATAEANVQSEDCRCPVWYASRHAEGAHVVPPGHNEGLDTRYGGELTA